MGAFTTRYEKVCEFCGKDHIAKRRDRKYCSKLCGERAQPNRCANHPDRAPRAQGLCSTCYNEQRYGSDRPRGTPKTCVTCGQQYKASRADQQYCSLRCRSGGQFLHVWTEAERRHSREKRRRRRAAMCATDVEQFDEREIYERDGWRCRIEGCGLRVDKRLSWPHPMSASLDHVIPLSEPGTSHTRCNVRLAHLRCNTSRSNRGGNEQLALIG